MADNPGIKIEALGFGSNTDFNNRITILQASNTLPDLGDSPTGPTCSRGA